MDYASIVDVNMAGTASAFARCNSKPLINNMLYMAPPVSLVKSYIPFTQTTSRSPKEHPRESFKDIRKSGRVKMTNYYHHKRTEEQFLGKITHKLCNRATSGCLGRTAATLCSDYAHSRDQKLGSYTEVTSLSDQLAKKVPLYVLTRPEDQSNQVLSDVASRASSTLDLLTEFAELKETVGFLQTAIKTALRPLKSFKDASDHIRKSGRPKEEIAKDIASLWLQYRYAIMPIVYTIEDIKKVLESKDHLYLTHSATSISQSQPAEIPEGLETYLYEEGTITSKYRCVTKARYSASALTFISLLGFNPARTAWELIPFSFVVDWFVNVGSFLEGLTFQMGDTSSERGTCISVRTTSVVQTFLVTKTNTIPAQHHISPQCGLIYTFEEIKGEPVELLLSRVTEDYYDRRVVRFSDISVELSPFLNWKRYLDAVSLSLKPTLKSLRRLQ